MSSRPATPCRATRRPPWAVPRACAMSLFLLVALIVVAPTSPALAQAVTPARGLPEPRVWLTASAGHMSFPQLNFLNSASRENVDAGTVLRGTVEIDAGKIGGLGVAYSQATVGVTYVGGSPQQGSACTQGCAATLDVASLMATLHIGGGLGLDQVFQASLGVTKFGGLEAAVDITGLQDEGTDFTAMIGYGAAYGFTRALSAMVVADIGLVFHDGPGGAAPDARYYSHYLGLRAGLRYGLWNRSP